MSALGAVCASAVVPLEAAIVAAPASFPTSRRVKCVADIESSHGIRLPFFCRAARSPILDMKRMLSKMDRSPTLEDRNSNVRFGSKADICSAQAHVRFTRKRTLALHLRMSAKGQADIGPTSDEHSDAWQDNPDLGQLARLVLLRYSGLGPLLETTRGLDRVVIGAIVVARDRP